MFDTLSFNMECYYFLGCAFTVVAKECKIIVFKDKMFNCKK